LRMTTSIPADIIGMGDQLGAIRPGYVANLVRLDKALMVKEVWRA
jgi:N-acetylglucosamine-6-phosphate deacetylase